MKHVFYTFFLFCVLTQASAQENFFRPDTIDSYSKFAIREAPLSLSSRRIVSYTNFNKEDSARLYLYDTITKSFTLLLTEYYKYDASNRITERIYGTIQRQRLYYNQSGLDSLSIVENRTGQEWTPSVTYESKYNANNDIIFFESKQAINGKFVKNFEHTSKYDENAQLIEFNVTSYLINEQNPVQRRLNYVYTHKDGRLSTEISKDKNYLTADTMWSAPYKYDYIYTNSDEKVDQKIASKFDVTTNMFLATDTIRYTYTANSVLEEYSKSRFFYKYDDNDNQIARKIEFKRDDNTWVTIDEYFFIYENDKIISKETYYLDLSDTIQVPFLTSKQLYKYKKVSNIEDKNINDDVSIKVYPNPSQNSVFIDCGNMAVRTVSLYDRQGQKVKAFDEPNPLIKIDRDDLPMGIYYVMIETERGLITKPIYFID
jgi:hypothetical protein